jgi:SWI/SNF-related matrix-associated actin-dependent regulator 1 of chromatin subfamily A
MSAGTIIDMGNEYQVDFAYRKTIVEAIKLIPGRRFDYRDKKWMVPKTSHDHLVRFAKMNRFEFGMQASNEPQQYDIAPEMPELTIDIPLKREMFPFQRTGVAYNLLHKRVIIGDQPGLGKTTTAFCNDYWC